MEGLFKVKYDKIFEQLDYSEIADEERKILFQGKKYDPAIHCISRLPVQIEPIQSRKKSARFWRRKGYENVTKAIVWAKIESPGLKLMGMLPNSTSVDGEQENKYSEEAILDHLLSPLTKLQLSGKAEQSFRRKQRIIIASRTSSEAQWAFEKIYLRDNLGFILIFLFEKQEAIADGQVRIKISFMDRGRDILSPKPRMVSISADNSTRKKP